MNDGCIAPIECEKGMPGCDYPEAHDHGFACDKSCAYCHGQGIPVFDPENHPNHREWRRVPSVGRVNMSELRCLDDRTHDPHSWDFGSGESFACDGWPDVGDCTDDCPEDCEADHQGEE